MLEGSTRGDPERILYWTLKSTRNLANALNELGHKISYVQVSRMLHELGYNLQSNRKVWEGKQHIDRDEQFRYIEKTCQRALKNNQPVISVDTKKKELVGNYLNKGSQWRKKRIQKK
jgi:arginine repressor